MKDIVKDYLAEKPVQSIICPDNRKKIYNSFSTPPTKYYGERPKLFHKGSVFMSLD